MDDVVNVWMLIEHLVESFLVCNIEFIESGSLPADELNAVDYFLGGVIEAVDDDDLVVGLEEG